MHSVLVFACLFFQQLLAAQTLSVLQAGKETSLRGLSVVDDQVIWVSGSRGLVGRSVDSGKSWTWITVPGMDKRDFRDIEAFDKNTAIIMAVDVPALILRTEDGGNTWSTVFGDDRKGMFLDALDFNGDYGMVVGDPIGGKLFLAETADQGRTWKERTEPALQVDSAEACFAASGTNIRVSGKEDFMVVTGGRHSRLLGNKIAITLPLIKGRESTGANSVAILHQGKKSGKKLIIAVGGDFAADSSSEGNCSFSVDNGKNWISPATPPRGYKSCIQFLTSRDLITCGTSGVDLSADGGMNWKQISSEGFHVVARAKKGKLVVLAGSKGRISVFNK